MYLEPKLGGKYTTQVLTINVGIPEDWSLNLGDELLEIGSSRYPVSLIANL